MSINRLSPNPSPAPSLHHLSCTCLYPSRLPSSPQTAFLLTVLLCWLVFIPGPKTAFFNWHPLGMTVGWCFLTPVAIWCERQPHVRKHWAHACLQIASSLCLAASFWVIWQHKIFKKKSHITTNHAWIGAAFLIVVAAHMLVSCVTMWPTKTAKDREPWRLVHIWWGLVSAILGIAAMAWGWFNMKAHRKNPWCTNNVVFVVGHMVLWGWLLLAPMKIKVCGLTLR